MGRAMKVFVIMVACGAALGAQGPVRQPIEGVWKVTEIVVTSIRNRVL